jgi:hypothetical protein
MMTLHLTESSVLPQELYDEIIGHFHDDLVTLASCALVSRSWLRSSRYHLSCQREIYERNAADLAKILTSSDAYTITSNGAVCHLHINYILALNTTVLQTVADRTDSIQLRLLSFVDVHWARDDLLVTPLLSFGMMIRELYVEKNYFRSVKDFISLLLAFPHLRRLEIEWSHAIGDGTSFSIDGIFRKIPGPVMPNLQVFKIVGDLVQPSLHYLSLSSNCGICDISVRYLRSRDITRVCEFVKGLGPCLENLELGLRGQEPLEELGE